MIKLYIAACTDASEHETATALAHYAIQDAFMLDAPLKKDSRGKPYFEGTDIHVSISHSHGLCLAAVSDTPVGADIEQKRRSDESLLRLSKRYFTADEAKYVANAPSTRFYEVWCAKESFIKFTGEGFSRTLSSFSVIDHSGEVRYSHFSHDNHVICVCASEHADSPPVFVSADQLRTSIV